MKTQIRHKFLNIRNSLSQEFVNSSGIALTELFLDSEYSKIPENKSIMLYSSFKNEADTWAIIDYYYNKGVKVVLPVTSGTQITPYEYAGKNSLIKDSFGILSPNIEICKPADIENIHTVIVPGVVFDGNGSRIGFGKGYYDRFLPKIPDTLKIGLCYEFQIVEYLPSDKYDIPMDFLLTEKGFINCKKQNYTNPYND